MTMLKKIAEMDSGAVLITGDGKRLAEIYLNVWGSRGKRILAEHLPFKVDGDVYIGSPFEGDDFDVYLILNPLSRPKEEREKLIEWLKEHRDKLVLLYESKYVKDSITRYKLRNFIDYLIAYKRETVGFERVDVMRLDGGKVVGGKTYVRRR